MSDTTLPRASLRLATEHQVLDARPGSVVPCVVRVHNDGREAVTFTVRVVGLGDDDSARPVPWEPLAPGGVLDLQIPVVVPETMAPGEHSVAVEVTVVPPRSTDGTPRSTPGRRAARPVVAIAPMTVKVGSLDQVVVRAHPSLLRGRRGARFELEIVNRRRDDVPVDLSASAPDLSVEFQPAHLVVPAGMTVRVPAKVRGGRHWLGEERQHVVNVEARGSSAPSYTRVVYKARPVVARSVRGVTAALVVLSLWAAAVGGAALWISKQGDEPAAEGTASGEPGSQPGGEGTTDGGSADGGSPGSGGAPGTDPDALTAPTATVLRGVVKAGDTGDDSGVVVTLTPLVPGEPAEAGAAGTEGAGTGDLTGTTTAAALSGLVGVGTLLGAVGQPAEGATTGAGKFWSVRYGTYDGNRLVDGRATVSVTAGSDNDGVWTIDDVPLRRTYELSFHKPGYNRQSFLVTPPSDGSPVEMDVVLEPGSGALGGRIDGPGGPLGGVAITITDGTFTYSATTSTAAGDRGEWLVEGLGTPATYTVTAVLDGYGTLVAQEDLTVGERDTSLRYTMRNGVGTISGLVTGDDGPLGGVLLTASGEGDQRTTSTLTAGATGTYLFPELTVPGTYTLTVSAPGYTTQTRQVTVGGNVTGVDFDLVRSTARVIGLVSSVEAGSGLPGSPIAGVGVEVSVENLAVRTSTVESPVLGSFSVDGLPPGTYTILFDRYDHVSESMLITLAAGQTLDLGEIELTYAPVPVYENDATLTVTFRDDENNLLDDVAVTVTDVAGRNPGFSSSGAVGSFSVSFPNVPIGTYRVLVTKTGHRPFVESRVTVGAADVTVNAVMLQYGQAFGQVVDGLAPYTVPPPPLPDPPPLGVSTRPLDNYRLLLYEVVGAAYVCRGTIAKGATPVDGAGLITWQVDAAKELLSGTYRLRFTPHPSDVASECVTEGGRVPNGYAALPDGNGDVATFVVPEDDDEPIDVGDIRVYPYPHLVGRVLVPTWNDSTETVDLLPAAALESVLGSSSVILRCVGRSPISTPLLFGQADDRVLFEFTREAVAGMFGGAPVPPGGSLGSCDLELAAPNYAPIDRTLPTALTIPTTFVAPTSTDGGGGDYDDRSLAIVLTDDPSDLTGEVGWYDEGTDEFIELGGVRVAATGVTVGYGASQAVNPDGPDALPLAPPDPEADPENLQSDSLFGSGIWGFLAPGPRQVADRSTYTVTATNFEPASFTLLVDEGLRQFGDELGFTRSLADDGSLQLALTPLDGSISGAITVVSGNPDPVIDAIVTGTEPGGPDVPVTVDDTLDYTFTSATAGTWQLTYGQAADSNLVVHGASGPVEAFVPPGLPADTPDVVEYWDLAQVTMQFEDTAGEPIDGVKNLVRTSVTRTSGNIVFPGVDPAPADADVDGVAVLRRLPVDAVLPTDLDVSYRLSVDAEGFDLAGAHWQVFAEGSDVVLAEGDDVRVIDITVRSGTRLRVEASMPAYGAVTGTAWGMLRPDSTEADDLEVLDLNTGLVITAVRVDADGTPLPDADPDAVIVTRVPTEPLDPPEGYRLDMPAGYYLITFSRPDFEDYTTPDPIEVGVNETVPLDVYLPILEGSFELRVITDTASGTPVVGADVGLWPEGTPVLDTLTEPPLYSGVTVAATAETPSIDFDPSSDTGIIPGDYLLVVRKSDPDDADRDDHFPVIATIRVPRGPDAETRTLRRTAVMPRTDGSIVGTVTVENRDGHELNVPIRLTVDRVYDIPQATGDTALPNDATEADQRPDPADSAVVALTPDTDGMQGGFLFEDLGAGLHTLTFSDRDGYATPDPEDVLVDGVGAATVSVVYYAENVDWKMRLESGGDPVTGLHPTAESPFGGSIEGVEIADEPGSYLFTDVAPEMGAYTVSLNSDYHRAATAGALLVTVPPSGDVFEPDAIEVVELAIIEGTARKLLTPTTSELFGTSETVQLLDSAGGLVASTHTDEVGGFQFVLDEGVAVASVQASVAGFTVESVPATATALATTTTDDLEVQAFASARFTVTNVAPTTVATLAASPTTGVAYSTATNGDLLATGLDPDVAYTFTISAPNRMTRTVPATGTHDPAIGTEFAQSVAMEGYVNITGTVEDGDGEFVDGAQVALVSGSSVAATTTSSTTDGTYTLTATAYGTYSVQAQLLGVGAGTSASTVTVGVGTVSPITGIDVTLAPRALSVNFTQGPTGPQLTITLDLEVGAPGQTDFETMEDAALVWQATASGYLQSSGDASFGGLGTFPLPMPSLTTDVPVTMVGNRISGTVNISGNGTAYLCKTSVAVANCNSTNDTGTPDPVSTNAKGFEFLKVPPGDYYVLVRDGSKLSQSGTISITLTMTTNPPAITLPAPVTPPATP